MDRMRGPDSGIAHVFIDGVFVSDVDMYARSYDVHVPCSLRGGWPTAAMR